MKYRFHSLDEFLISVPLTVDGQLDDGWNAAFPVKGRELEATILFADITSFSARTLDLTPTETLAYVNNFFAWISAEALRHGNGVVDKYIGDEIMVVFAHEFSSDDPFQDAVRTARFMADNDAHSFVPHIGIASGPVVVGYVGTPLKYNCSRLRRAGTRQRSSSPQANGRHATSMLCSCRRSTGIRMARHLSTRTRGSCSTRALPQ